MFSKMILTVIVDLSVVLMKKNPTFYPFFFTKEADNLDRCGAKVRGQRHLLFGGSKQELKFVNATL